MKKFMLMLATLAMLAFSACAEVPLDGEEVDGGGISLIEEALTPGFITGTITKSSSQTTTGGVNVGYIAKVGYTYRNSVTFGTGPGEFTYELFNPHQSVRWIFKGQPQGKNVHVTISGLPQGSDLNSVSCNSNRVVTVCAFLNGPTPGNPSPYMGGCATTGGGYPGVINLDLNLNQTNFGAWGWIPGSARDKDAPVITTEVSYTAHAGVPGTSDLGCPTGSIVNGNPNPTVKALLYWEGYIENLP